jgi:hypothetical protein
MKKLLLIPALLIILFLCTFFTQKNKVAKDAAKIENTLVSVSFWKDSLNIAPSDLLLSIQRVNRTISAQGYPDAGYKLWIIQGDANKEIRFMMEGYWPDQATYDLIHNNVSYKDAARDALLGKLRMVSYHRFTLVK